MRDSIIDGLMERIEYALSSCEVNGRLSNEQQQDFDAACYRLRHFGEEAEKYVLDCINQIKRLLA